MRQASQGPARIILASRTPAKIQECIDALKTEYPNVEYRALQMDLGSQKSVRAAAAEVLSWSDVPTIDIIVNCAAVMGISERTLSPEGIELHFATNHIGHFLFTNLLMPKLIKAADGKPKGTVRVVNISSGSPWVSTIRWSDHNFEKKTKELPESERPNTQTHEMFGYKDVENMSYIPIEGYNQSKIANLLFSIGATERLYEKYGILSFAVHPGVIETELTRTWTETLTSAVDQMKNSGVFQLKSLGAGAASGLVAALDPNLGPPRTSFGIENYGAYFDDCQISSKALPPNQSSSEADKMWKLSEELVGQKFDY